MSTDSSLTNVGEYFSAYYLTESLPEELKRTTIKEWAAKEKLQEQTPRTRFAKLRADYFASRTLLADGADPLDGGVWRKNLAELHDRVLVALGFTPSREVLTVEDTAGEVEIPLVYQDKDVFVVEAGFAVELEQVRQEAGVLAAPVNAKPKDVDTGMKLVSYLFANTDTRYGLLLVGGIVILADRYEWGESRYLAVNLDMALSRMDRKVGGEIDVISALFSHEALRTPDEGGENPLTELLSSSRQQAVGVSTELRAGLQRSVELIGNEVLDQLRSAEWTNEDIAQNVSARQLTTESLRYLYRILFLLFAEARPELGILPTDYPEYGEGYGLGRLGELVERPTLPDNTWDGYHFYESLNLLFHKVNNGYRPLGTDEVTSEGRGIRFESLRSNLFDDKSITLIGDNAVVGNQEVKIRLRNKCLHLVLRSLMITKGNAKRRGGHISYAQLGINQLGAVYEGLMSYSGFIADEMLREVARPGKHEEGTWLARADQLADYDDDDPVFVTRETESGEKVKIAYQPGSFVYRLSGRDRQTSASYYTPESLTKVTVQLALAQRFKESPHEVPAQEMLTWTICEPALGSGAFLNEAINQVATEYLRLRQKELGEKIATEEYDQELRKAKAYIALHNSYGVDLNSTAVELAEVSMWLNVMHPGMKAPWFGMHLRNGNSLLGARRAYYTQAEAKGVKWYAAKETLGPTELPFRDGALPKNAIHQFLMPAIGWGAVAGHKEARALASKENEALAAWRKNFRKKLTDRQVTRLQGLARRVEYLWAMVLRRLEISEREISRPIDVWGADNLRHPEQNLDRNEILAELGAKGTPFWRLKLIMDTWCALWMWPLAEVSWLDGTHESYPQRAQSLAEMEKTVNFQDQYALDADEPEKFALPTSTKTKSAKQTKADDAKRLVVALSNVDDWLLFCEDVIGHVDANEEGTLTSVAADTLDQMTSIEAELPTLMNALNVGQLYNRFPWKQTAEEIADEQHFFHWELYFANVFAGAVGGFDLQVGNPPWVRPDWNESLVLAEHDPWFGLVEKPKEEMRSARKKELVEDEHARGVVLDELTVNVGSVELLSSEVTYPLIAGTRPDLYRGFMCQVWRHGGKGGTSGLLHPDSHMGGVNEGRLRAAAYRQLRVHGVHVNEANWAFEEVDHHTAFGVNVYGPRHDIDFLHASHLFGPAVLVDSIVHDGEGMLPGLKLNGTWDTRPHAGRVIRVDNAVLKNWRNLGGNLEIPIEQTPLLYPVTIAEQGAIDALGAVPHRLGELQPWISSGYNEKTAKDKGYIRFDTTAQTDWSEVILQGPHIGVGTPFPKQPNIPCKSNLDWSSLNFVTLPSDMIPVTNYRRATERDQFIAVQKSWGGASYSNFYRLAWRKMLSMATERTLFAALIPKGATHIDGLQSLGFDNVLSTVANAGYWAALPMDYLLRITGRANLHEADVARMPAVEVEQPLTPSLILRVLRLNCINDAYVSLWSELDASSIKDGWAYPWPNLPPLNDVSPTWTPATPLRSELSRRAALVELDALVSVMLNISATQLSAIYTSRYPVLSGYEENMYFDATGRQIAKSHNAFGYGQTKEHYLALIQHLDSKGKAPAPDGYTAPFYKADRVKEMTAAHAEFTRRLTALQNEGTH